MSFSQQRPYYSLNRMYTLPNENQNSIHVNNKVKTSRRKTRTSLKIQVIQFRKFEPQQQYERKNMYVRRSQRKKQVKSILNKFKSQYGPSNASKSVHKIELPSVLTLKLKENPYKHFSNDHLTYDQLLICRQRQQDDKRVKILKQVIKENVKKKNQQMRIRSKKRLRTVI